VELWRKLLQTSVFVFASQADTDEGRASAQIVFLLAICSVSLVVIGWLDPYAQRTFQISFLLTACAKVVKK
jgi:hypothetical protein